jgi:hypothetical protein
MMSTLDSIVRKPSVINDAVRSVSRFVAGGILALSLSGCPMSDVKPPVPPPPPPPPPVIVECPFNPAVEYARENNILGDFDVAGFGDYCFWDPVKDADKSPSSFLDPFEHNRTKDMLDWMHELDADGFYTHDQVQSLVDRFGDGVINPGTGQRVGQDTGLVNIDEYLAARDFYEKAKEMHDWAIANQHRAESIKPEHYQNFNAWSVRLFGWPYPDKEFDMPKNNSLLEITGLEPSVGFRGLSTVNWGLTEYGTPDYEPLGFIAIEGRVLGKPEWEQCKYAVQDARASSQNFVPDNIYLMNYNIVNVSVRSMLYSPGEVVLIDISAPALVDWMDMTIRVEYPISATLMDIGGYVDGHKLMMDYAHISGREGNMSDVLLPGIGDTISPRSVFAWLNSQRPYLLGDFQGYVPEESSIPGPHPPGLGHRTQVDMFLEALRPGEKAGWNDPRANRHDEPANYSVAIGNRSFFAPCIYGIHEPK